MNTNHTEIRLSFVFFSAVVLMNIVSNGTTITANGHWDKSFAPLTVDSMIASEMKILPGGVNDRAEFGIAVDVDGDFAVIGAYHDDDNGTDSGAAYLFKRIGYDWYYRGKLVSSDIAEGDNFGVSVAISGDTIIVGSQRDDDGGRDSGSAYVFTRSGANWIQTAKLTASDASPNAIFGTSVAIDGNTVVVGAPFANEYAGLAYVFVREEAGWRSSVENARLYPSVPGVFDMFGSSVTVSGELVVVGSPLHDSAAGDGGAVYIYERLQSGWWDMKQKAKVTASDARARDHFGHSVSIDGNRVAVGSPLNDEGGNDAGAVYLYALSDATKPYAIEIAKLLPAASASGDQFGTSVAISGDTVLAGAPRKDAGEVLSGAAYVFFNDGSGWNEQAELTASHVRMGDQFGFSAALDGNVALLGAPYDDAAGTDSGAAYVFRRVYGEWSQPFKLMEQLPEAGSLFGKSVAIVGDTAVVGTYWDDEAGNSAGAVHIFVRDAQGWDHVAKLMADDAQPYDQFGTFVAFDGETVVVGSPGDDDGGDSAGFAYVFVRDGDNWIQQDKLIASDAGNYDSFGMSVAVSGDTIIVGSPNDGIDYVGSAYVFVRTNENWTEEAKIIPDDLDYSAHFGISVALEDNTAVIGAYQEDEDGDNSGAAYVYARELTGWLQTAKLKPTPSGFYEWFGISVDIDGDTIAVGAQKYDGLANETGSAYVFTNNDGHWIQAARLTASDGESADWLGQSVSLMNDVVVAGAPWNGIEAGAVYVFARQTAQWSDMTETLKITASDMDQEDTFGTSVSFDDSMLIVGSPGNDDCGYGAGAAYIYELDIPLPKPTPERLTEKSEMPQRNLYVPLRNVTPTPVIKRYIIPPATPTPTPTSRR